MRQRGAVHVWGRECTNPRGRARVRPGGSRLGARVHARAGGAVHAWGHESTHLRGRAFAHSCRFVDSGYFQGAGQLAPNFCAGRAELARRAKCV